MSCGSLLSPRRALPTETNVGSRTSQTKSGTSINLSNSGLKGGIQASATTHGVGRWKLEHSTQRLRITSAIDTQVRTPSRYVSACICSVLFCLNRVTPQFTHRLCASLKARLERNKEEEDDLSLLADLVSPGFFGSTVDVFLQG